MNTYRITHHPTTNRFEAELDGYVAYIEYVPEGSCLDIVHTVVPTAIQGRGIAAALMKGLLTYASQHEKQVKASCSYAQVYMRRYPEYTHLLEVK